MTAEPLTHINCVLLAAGQSRRFGSDKRHYQLETQSLLQRSLSVPLGLGINTLLVLKPEDADQLQSLLGPYLTDKNLSVIYAEEARQGMGHSLAAAALVLKEQTLKEQAKAGQGTMIMLADMPYIRTETLTQLIEIHQQYLGAKKIIIPTHRGRRGHPVLFSAGWLEKLEQLEGDTGAKSLISANPESVLELEVDDPGVLQDIDTPPN